MIRIDDIYFTEYNNSPIQQKNEECFNKAKKLEMKVFDSYGN